MARKKTFNYYSGKRYDGMMARCYRESDTSYKYYGKIGIRVCSDWITNIDGFRTWLLLELSKEGIEIEEFVENSKKYQIDRRDSEGHYTPENCRILSPQDNSRNKSKPLKIIESAEGNKHRI